MFFLQRMEGSSGTVFPVGNSAEVSALLGYTVNLTIPLQGINLAEMLSAPAEGPRGDMV